MPTRRSCSPRFPRLSCDPCHLAPQSARPGSCIEPSLLISGLFVTGGGFLEMGGVPLMGDDFSALILRKGVLLLVFIVVVVCLAEELPSSKTRRW